MKKLIKHFNQNPYGRDFVVGDIHGMFKHLMFVLKSIDFDFKKDRLFSVGDLCDRGPDSKDVLEWLDYPWFFPVMGNHEEILLLYEAGVYNDKDLVNVGAAWWLNYPDKLKKEVIKKYKELPIAQDVETSSGLVGIIHAECPHADWNKLSEIFSGMYASRMISKALWSTMSPLNDDIIQSVKGVVVGHMTQSHYMVRGNVHLIDTGAVYPQGHFTILNLDDLFPVEQFV